jgi:1,4-dihydroxy-2-naphthoate octaprenyltransferase
MHSPTPAAAGHGGPTAAQWLEGARPKTLPAALAPVVLGTGAAAAADAVVWWKALLALVVALSLQIGVNYANDYSDGIRGTDANRVGPFRLVGSGAARPALVRRAAFLAFGVGAVAGLVLAVTTSLWLLLVGAAALAAAWTYTGGPAPYGYRGFGELSVFVFFGLVAVLGTTYVQAERLTGVAIVCAVAIGLLACALLIANNLRDLPTDAAAGKRTLAVLLGNARTRAAFVACLLLPFVAALVVAPAHPAALLALLALLLAVPSAQRVRAGAVGPALIPVLRDSGRTELAFAVLMAIGLAIS